MISIIKFNYSSDSNMNNQSSQMEDINSPYQHPPQLCPEPSFSFIKPPRQESLFSNDFQQKIETFQKQQHQNGIPFTSRRKKKTWNHEENMLLLKLHDQFGNKWSVIARHFDQKTQNDIKNHFFSRLRMSLRHLNRGHSMSKAQSVKVGVLYKMMAVCEEGFRGQSKNEKQLLELSLEIKRSIFNFLNYPPDSNKIQIQTILQNIKTFNSMTQISTKKGPSNTLKETQYQKKPLIEQKSETKVNIQQKRACKILYKKTACEDEQQPSNKEFSKESAQTPSTNELIAKPSFCLLDPFQQVNSLLGMDQDSFLYPQTIKFVPFEEQSNSNDFQQVHYTSPLNQFSPI